MLYLTNTVKKPPPNRHLRKVSRATMLKWIQKVKDEFVHRYGKEYADKLFTKGVQSFGSIDATAQRMVQAAQENRPFVVAFSGYSITVGRGNYFNQSFPFVFEQVLKGPMEAILGVPLVVRNAAIGGIPSFPYGFCLEHFLGADADVIGWDYSMNENSRNPAVFEAFIRQSIQQLPKRPMLIMLEQNRVRMNLLEQYTAKGYLQDAIAVAKKDAVDNKVFEQEALPEGFQKWDEFGAPQNCPGRSDWHPKRQEHAMIGWLMAMHFVEALKRAHELQQSKEIMTTIHDPSKLFDKPFSDKIPENDKQVLGILYGHDTEEGDNKLLMKDVSCRTSFLPATDHTKVLPSLVVSGFAEGDLDIMEPRTDAHYKEGWVLDVSKIERDTKRKVETCGGLGYIDMKIAMYGIPESGKLRMWLPYEGTSNGSAGEDSDANQWFSSLVICEANEKRSDKACKLDRDLEIAIGGIPVTTIHPVKGAAEYLKRQTCVSVQIPQNAMVNRLGKVRSTDGRPLFVEDKKKFGGDDQAVGLEVDFTAKPSVKRAFGACCLSHIVWEQH